MQLVNEKVLNLRLDFVLLSFTLTLPVYVTHVVQKVFIIFSLRFFLSNFFLVDPDRVRPRAVDGGEVGSLRQRNTCGGSRSARPGINAGSLGFKLEDFPRRL